MSKRAIFVTGPESSGTKIMTRIMIMAGCYGQDTNKQALDMGLDNKPDLIVFRRSVPHMGKLETVEHWIRKMWAENYDVKVIYTSRNFFEMSKSQVKQGHVGMIHQAEQNIRMAKEMIEVGLMAVKCEFVMSQYEDLVRYKQEHVRFICERLGLGTPAIPANLIYDGNEKYKKG